MFRWRLQFPLVVLAVWMCASAVDSAQTQPPIRSKVVLVPLDVRILDGDGNPVRDLTAADFTIYEDGVRQELAHFVPISLTGQSARLADDHPLAEASRPHRTFILVLGTGDINAPGKALDGLIDFVRHRLAPTDRVGVTAYLRTSEPTTDHGAVVRFLERYREDCKSLYDRIFWDRRPRDGLLGDLSNETLARIDAVFRTPGVPLFTELPGVPGKAAARYATFNYIRWTIQHGRRIPGEKHVIVLAHDRLGVGRAGVSPNNDIYVKLATEARVALSYINTGGTPDMGMPTMTQALAPPPGRNTLRPIEHSDFFAPTDHRQVTESTGGIASFYRYANVPLDRIERASRFEYLLGYYPNVTHAPDVHRTVRVEVNRRDVTAQYRHGYRFAPSVNDEQDFRAVAIDYRLTTELAWLTDRLTETRLRQSGLRRPPSLRITTQRVAGKDGGVEMKVALAFNPRPVSFAGDDHSKRAVLDVAVVLDDHKGNPIAELIRSVELSLTARELAQAKDQWIEFDVTLPFKGEPARIRAAVYDYIRDGIRSAVLPIPQRK